MGCKFDYIEKAFRESNPELADKLNKEHEDLLRSLLTSGEYINDNGTLKKVEKPQQTNSNQSEIDKIEAEQAKPTQQTSEVEGITKAQELAISQMQKLYPEIKVGFTQDGKSFEVGDGKVVMNQNQLNEVSYNLKAVDILTSDKAKQVFAKGEKNGWDLNKILTELQIPKEQKQIILDKYKDKISEINSTSINSTIYELDKNISNNKIRDIYNNYKKLIESKRPGTAIPLDTFKNLLKTLQVFNYKNTYIFGNYDINNAVFISRFNSSPTSKELLAEALPTLIRQGIDFISFVPTDVADKYKRSGYSVSSKGFKYNFKGEDMIKYLSTSNVKKVKQIFGKDISEINGQEIKEYNNKQGLNYTPVEIKGDLIKKAGKDASKILETYLNQFGIIVKDIDLIKNKLGIDEVGFADLLSKIAYVKDKKDLPPISGEFIAYMMQYNPLVSDIIEELSQTKNYKNLDKSEYFKIIGGLISDDLQNKLDSNYSKSLLEKLKQLIKDFFSLLNNTPIDLINQNIGIISNNILQQNKKLITASLYKPGAFGKPTKQVSLKEALDSDKFGATIINELSKKGFILTGSTSLGEQGTIQRPDENLLHDIDWRSPFNREETEELFKESYPEAIKIRDIYGEDYVTDSWIIAPKGYKIINLIKESDYNIITNYDIVDNQGNIKGTFRLETQEGDNQKEEIVSGIEAKVIDFFSYEKFEQRKPFEKNNIKLANWKGIFKDKLQFSRYKDIWDYNRFIPNENINDLREEILLQQDKQGNIKGQANIDAMTVLFDKDRLTTDTIYHKYAHHYIAWNRDAPIVQKAIKKWGNEESLVQAIGEQAEKQKGEAWEWFKKFIAWLKNDINKLDNLDKEKLKNILTDAFLNRESLTQQTSASEVEENIIASENPAISVNEKGGASINIFKSEAVKAMLETSEKNNIGVQEDYTGIDKSRIIHFGGHTGELKMNLEGDNPQAEALVPSKFRDESGELIDLYEGFNKKKGEGKYLIVKNGSVSLKEEMFDPEVFENFMFRIPTSSHGLGATVKIVGFLPPESGDLAITPKNFVAKMGQDFDIDKLTAYQYHTGLGKNGKIEKFKPEHAEKQLRHLKSKLKAETDFLSQKEGATEEGTLYDPKDIPKRKDASVLQAVEMLDKILKNVLSEDDYDAILNDKKRSIEKSINLLEKALKKKVNENNLIEIHNSVFKNKDNKIQKKIHKTLSMKEAEDQADAIDKVKNSSSNIVNLLSPKYQKEKLKLGSTGAMAIGIYSKAVTFHSLLSQLDSPLRFEKSVTFGKLKTNNILGKPETLISSDDKFIQSKQRAISEVLDEKTNTATDNEKAQILGRVGLSYRESLGVDVVMSMQGIDMDIEILTKGTYNEKNPFHKKEQFEGETVYYAQYSIPYLVHSHPTIQNLLKLSDNTKGQVYQGFSLSFTSLLKTEIAELNEKLTKLKIPEDKRYDPTLLTGKTLVEGLTGEMSLVAEYSLLKEYEVLVEQANLLRESSSIIDNNELGKSLFESIEKKDNFVKLLTNDLYPLESKEDTIVGSSKLLGDVSETPQEGFTRIHPNLYFKPTTNRGHALNNAYKMAEVFNTVYPYQKRSFKEGMDRILSTLNREEYSNNSEMKETIFKEMRKFITSATHLGLFDNVNEARKDLFFDISEDNKSLSTYLNDIFLTKPEDSTSAISSIKNNVLLSRMEYRTGFNGKPSLILFSNTDSKSISEEYFREAFTELILNNKKLPDKNGQPYSTRQLATDLIKYSFLSGGITQSAVDFHKFIPLDYLEDLTTEMNGEEIPVLGIFRMHNHKDAGWATKFHKFEIQFLQNNPKLLKTLNSLDYRYDMDAMRKAAKDKPFILEEEEGMKITKVLIIPTPVGFDRYPLAGSFGMSEYDYNETAIKTPISEIVKGEILEAESSAPELSPEEQAEILKNMFAGNSSMFTPISETLGLEAGKSYTISETINMLLELDNISSNSTIQDILKVLSPLAPENGLIQVIDEEGNNKKAYSGRDKDGNEVIVLNINKLNKGGFTDFVETIGHEYIHSITVKELTPYLDSDGRVNQDAPKEILALQDVFDTYEKHIKDTYGDEFIEFKKKVDQFKNDNSLPASFTPFERNVLYPAYNIKEFLAITLANNQAYIKETKDIPWSGNKTLLERFGEVIERLLNSILSKRETDTSLAQASIYTSLLAVEVLNDTKLSEFSQSILNKNDTFAEEVDINAALAEAAQEEGDSDYYSDTFNNSEFNNLEENCI